MKMNVNQAITELVKYALATGLIEKDDEAYATAGILEALGLSDYEREEAAEAPSLAEILDRLTDFAAERGLLAGDGVAARDLFDTKLMGVVTARPSEVNRRFRELYEESPEAATDWFYALACNSNYIRRDRIARDVKWRYASEFGELDVTINLSKPEKDPKAIAAAKLLPPSGFPKCLLCHENEGFAGNLAKPARQNLRQIPFEMDGERWYLQYSPYVYYNEHCIALSARHTPMCINRSTFAKLLGFVGHFPHYFIGSNADLPIVGGSILAHDHMQGGRYSFAMERAEIEREIEFRGFDDVRAGIVKWPLSVIRLTASAPERLVELADAILGAWRSYSDEAADIYAATRGEPHNTITPIARRRGGDYQLDLVLRNNRTSAEHPLGIFHPHEEHHNIKKENIGLIEVMGLAVLPARLKAEMREMREAILGGRDFAESAAIAKHKSWFLAFKDDYTFTEDNCEDILKREIGKTFARVLCDAGVYKTTPEGRAAFLRFVEHVDSSL